MCVAFDMAYSIQIAEHAIKGDLIQADCKGKTIWERYVKILRRNSQNANNITGHYGSFGKIFSESEQFEPYFGVASNFTGVQKAVKKANEIVEKQLADNLCEEDFEVTDEVKEVFDENYFSKSEIFTMWKHYQKLTEEFPQATPEQREYFPRLSELVLVAKKAQKNDETELYLKTMSQYDSIRGSAALRPKDKKLGDDDKVNANNVDFGSLVWLIENKEGFLDPERMRAKYPQTKDDIHKICLDLINNVRLNLGKDKLEELPSWSKSRELEDIYVDEEDDYEEDNDE
jgi:hypothetical protein